MNMVKASQSLGAKANVRTFFKIIMPLILPGVISGALFAFITSFDEVVVVMFMASLDQLTIPKQMWAGIRQEISPVILCMATCLVILSIFLLSTVELLKETFRKTTWYNFKVISMQAKTTYCSCRSWHSGYLFCLFFK